MTWAQWHAAQQLHSGVAHQGSSPKGLSGYAGSTELGYEHVRRLAGCCTWGDTMLRMLHKMPIFSFNRRCLSSGRCLSGMQAKAGAQMSPFRRSLSPPEGDAQARAERAEEQVHKALRAPHTAIRLCIMIISCTYTDDVRLPGCAAHDRIEESQCPGGG